MADKAMSMSVAFKAIDQMSSIFDKMSLLGEKASSNWETAGNVADKAYAKATEGVNETANAMSNATISQEGLASAVDNYNSSTLQATSTTNEFSNANSMVSDVLQSETNIIGNTSNSLSELADEFENTGESSNNFGQRAEDAVNKVEKILVSAGIIKGLQAIQNAFDEASEAAAVFETGVAKISTIADSAEKSMGEIRGEIVKLSNDTGQAVSDLSESTYGAISASVDTASAVSFVATSNKLAVGGFTETATAVDVLTTAVNAYGLETKDANNISDMLITTQNLGKTTVDELAKSVGKVIPIAAAYNVEMDNLSAAYAVTTANGIATAEAGTYLKQMLTELGSAGSDVSDILKNETGMAFAELMDSGYSLGDVLEILGNSVNGNTTEFSNLWGSTTAGTAALSLFNAGAENFNSTLAEMQNSAGATSAAYNTMANTTAFAQNKMQNSFKNLGATVGEQINPLKKVFYETTASIVNTISAVLEAHPVFTSFLISVTVALSALVAGIAIFNIIMPIATVVTKIFGAALSLALWPLTLIVAAIAIVVGGLMLLIYCLNNTNEEFDSLTATSKQQYEELERLNNEYREAVELHGELDDSATDLRLEIEELEREFQRCRMTYAEFVEQNDALIDSFEEVANAYKDGIRNINKSEKDAEVLIGKLSMLGNETSLTASEQQQMSIIMDRLNEQYPQLNMTVDDLTNSLDKNIQIMHELAEAQAEELRLATQYDAYVDSLSQQIDLEEQLLLARKQRMAAEERSNAAGWWSSTFGSAKKDLEAYTEEEFRLADAYVECNRIMSETEQVFQDYSDSLQAAINDTDGYKVAVNLAVDSVSNAMQELIEDYDKAYESARNSIASTIGLFDTMSIKCELSINDMKNAMQSQVEYLTTYTENLNKAAEYGLDKGLIASLSDGSEKSAGDINTIINEIERLGATTESLSAEASAFINEFNGAFKEVQVLEDEFADSVATIETDFNNAMDEIQLRMEEAIDDMDMSNEAAEQARETIQAYIDQIKSMTNEAHSAAEGVALATASALGGSTISFGSVNEYAVGTLSAEPGLAVVGERGPELVNFGGGEVVYTADETSRILADSGDKPIQTSVPDSFISSNKELNSNNASVEKKITLDINGSGEFEVSGNYDDERIWDVMSSQLKPVLLNMLKEEMFEEGDLAYEF